jgi:hypothetical protein
MVIWVYCFMDLLLYVYLHHGTFEGMQLETRPSIFLDIQVVTIKQGSRIRLKPLP